MSDASTGLPRASARVRAAAFLLPAILIGQGLWQFTPVASASAVPAPPPTVPTMAPTATAGTAAVTVAAGASGSVALSVDVPTNPPKADILIAIDTTGSMGSSIAQAKTDATNVVNGVKASVPDSQFAVVDFRDSSDGSNQYRVTAAMTADASVVQAAINAMTDGGGGDLPEAHNLVFHNSYTPGVGLPIGWRTGTKKIVVVISDAEPHGAGAAGQGLAGCADTTGDPNGYSTSTELSGMAAADRTLFMIRQATTASTTLACYESIAARTTNGDAVDGGAALGAQIVTLIQSSFAASVTDLHMEVSATPAPAAPAVSSWVSFTPPTVLPPYPTPSIQSFTANVTVPSGTTVGTYAFDLVALADGVDIGHTTLTVTVPSPVATVGVPSLSQAVPQGVNTLVAGVLRADPSTTYHLRFLTAASCTDGVLGADAVTFATRDAVTNADGDSYFGGSVANTSALLTYVAAQIVPPGASSAVGPCIVASPDNDQWPRALDVTGPGASSGYIDAPGRARWYKFAIQPGSRVSVTLSNVPADYDLFLFKDIGQAYTSLTDTASLTRLSAEFAPSAFSPSAFSPSAFSPSAFSPSAFSPSAFSPSAFSPSAFSPSAFSPSAFSPSAFSPSAFSPSAFSPSGFSPSAFSSAQTRSLIGVSAGAGVGSETVVADTWNNTGSFYVRVSGKNGDSSLVAPFSVTVAVDGNLCSGVGPIGPAPTSAPALALKTLILEDSSRLPGTAAEISSLQAKLDLLAARPEVAGARIDLASNARIQSLNTQANANTPCIYAKNLVASGIKDIVTAYRASNPGLQYIVLVGGDQAIPFFRYPDQSLLGPEQDYVPPVGSTTASEASLRSNYVLGQDAYGASTELSLRASTFPVPDLAVGRLVETASEAAGLIDGYLATAAGVVATPTTSLVTGYDFLADAADSVQADLTAGTGLPGDTLITPNTVAPTAGWTATQLKTALLGSRHDLIFLAGHFSANNALAADFSTTVNSTDLAAAAVDLTNSIIFSAGCHAGYNLVDGDAIGGVTQPLDWSQAFARKRATLIAGTGYQYGDTDFLEYSERIYAEFAHQLRVGTGPVSIGQALIRAKQIYLASTPDIRGLHEKALLESTIFGLPMLSVNMPAGRVAAPSTTSIVGSTSGFAANPGLGLGLRSADVSINPATSAHTVTLQTLDATGAPVSGGSVTATYYSGRDGVVTNPGEPALPLQSENVNVPSKVLRGVGFRGGTFTDSTVVPLTGAAATEIRGVHTAFSSTVFYPMRPWTVNYYDALSGGATRLLVTPAQHKVAAIGDTNTTLRRYSSLGVRLFYSDYVGDAAQSAAPTITGLQATANGAVVTFRAHVVGNPAAGIQQVWITHNGTPNTWQSFDLVQDTTDSTSWAGTLTLPGGTSTDDLRFMVQAVNGVGLVTMDDNLGAYYAVTVTPATAPVATSLVLGASPTNGSYGSQASFTATLSGGTAVVGKTVVFTVGATTRIATTNASGVATAALPLTSVPGGYSLRASFAGDLTSAASDAARAFTINKLGTTVTITVAPPPVPLGADSGVTATLKDANGAPLGFRTIFFILSGAASRTTVAITDFAGRASLGTLPSTVGTYTVAACFNGPSPAACASLSIPDSTYSPSGATVNVRHIWPFAGFFSPVDNLPTVNLASAGNTIPVKFSLGGNRGLAIFATGYPKAVMVTCATGFATDTIEETSTANSGLTYDATTNQYKYNWKTPKTYAGKCYQLDVRFVDGSTYSALFKFK